MFERSWTVNLAQGAEAQLELNLPDGQPELEISAWSASYVAATGFLIFSGALNTVEIANRLSSNPVDALLSVPSGGAGKVWIPGDLRYITVYAFTLTASATPNICTVRVRSV